VTVDHASGIVLEARDISKHFGGTWALDHVNLAAREGEVHALLGENGAGKSTLVKIISGALQPDSGSLHVRGQLIRVDSPHQATALGITIVHQNSAVIPSLTLAENIFLGRVPQGRLGLVDWPRLFRDAEKIVADLGFELDVRRKVGDLGTAARQLAGIARALSINAHTIIMDEPSASLGPAELDKLFRAITALKRARKTLLYISHRLQEIFDIADRVTVLKDGHNVGTYDMGPHIDRSFLISRMVGREWKDQFPKRAASPKAELLRVEGLSRRGAFEDINLTLREGEIVGLAGLVGSGRTELCRVLFGADVPDAGRVLLSGRPVRIRSPRSALGNGIAYLSEDRHREGLVLCLSVGHNLTLPVLGRFLRAGLLQLKAEAYFVEQIMQQVGVRARGRNQLVGTLSGGNQQKVALGKWLATQAKVFLLDEPTVGIDVGAKREIYELMNTLAENGAAVLMVSSEVPELLAMSDRVIVLRCGQIVGELRAADATEEDVMRCAA
jgi:ribose transport system ATP-binding protein